MSVATGCPDPAKLAQLLAGSASVDAMESFVRHVETCSACAGRLGQESASSSVWKFVGQPDQPTPLGLDGRLEALLARCDQNLSADATPVGHAMPANPLASDDVEAFGYKIISELGRGGMGVVYKAHDSKRGDTVALKTLQWLDPQVLFRFKQEFRALAGVDHPNLVRLYELISDGRHWFFTMAYVPGTHFLAYVRPHGKPDTQRLCESLRQLATAVHALHEAGLLHRDIKPSNVLVTSEGRVVLVDFGLATELDQAGWHRSTQQGLVGTVAYMAPEQAAKQAMSPATDWYSVGVVLYEALTGLLPYRGGPLQILADKQVKDPPAPHDLADGVDPDLEALCLELLARRPEMRPSGASVLQRLSMEDLPKTLAGPRLSVGVPFVGRLEHMHVLRSAYAAMREGRTVAISVHGRSGVGKSALVHRFLEEVSTDHAAVILSGRCYEQESVPYKALDSLVDALSRYLGRLSFLEAQALLPRDIAQLARSFPVLGRVDAVAKAPIRSAESPDPHEARRRASAALRELLARLGDRQPLVLFIDDMQWGDVDSAALLVDLLRPVDPPTLLLVGSYRTEDMARSPFLRVYRESLNDITPASARHELPLEALTPAESRSLALELLASAGSETQLQAEAVARESGGNPFFVYELVQHLQRTGGHRESVLGEIGLDEVVWKHIVHLPEAARRLVEIIAVSGRPLPLAKACRAAQVSDEREASIPLRTGRLVRVQREEIDTYHDRIRETILARLDGAALADCHRRLAETLATDESEDPEVLAVHFHGAGQTERASAYYAAAAGKAANALAFEHAAHLYRQALHLRSVGGPEERTLRSRLGEALANAGQGVEAAREYLAAAAGATPAEALEFQHQAGLQLLTSGQVDEGVRTLAPVLQAWGMPLATSPLRALLSLLFRRALTWFRGVGFRERSVNEINPEDLQRIDVCWSVATGLLLIDPFRSAPFLTRGLQLALRAGDSHRIARVLPLEATFISSAGWWAKPRAMKLTRIANDLANKTGHPRALGLAEFMVGAMAYLEGSHRAGLEHCDRAEQIFRAHGVGVTWELDATRIFSLWCLNQMGEINELRRRAWALLEEARKRGNLFAITNISTFNMAVVWLAADKPGEGRLSIEEAITKWSQKGYHVQHHNAFIGALHIDLYDGNPRAAWDRISATWQPFWKSLLGRVQNLRIHMLQFRAFGALAMAATAADAKKFLRVAKRDARRLRRERVPWPCALETYIRAAIAALEGDTANAQTLLAAAIADYEADDMRLYAAATRRRLGEWIGGPDGEALIAQADAWMASQEIRNPIRMTAAFAPGFVSPDDAGRSATGMAATRN